MKIATPRARSLIREALNALRAHDSSAEQVAIVRDVAARLGWSIAEVWAGIYNEIENEDAAERVDGQKRAP